jgi:CDI immunity proteins
MKIDRAKTLEILDGEKWGEPEYDSHLVTTIHGLRKKPLKDFSIEDLRICIGQQFFLGYLIPIAIEELEKNPFAEGDFYIGDLLEKVLDVKEEYWINHSGQKNKIIFIIQKALTMVNTLDDINSPNISKILGKGKLKFNSIP